VHLSSEVAAPSSHKVEFVFCTTSLFAPDIASEDLADSA
jgi:hypothetical protein